MEIELRDTISVRRGCPEDYPELALIFLKARQQAFLWRDPSEYVLDAFYGQTAGEIIFVAEDVTGKLMGFVSVWEENSFIHHLFIDPDYQGKGAGSALMKSLFSWLPLPYRLKCATQNHKALVFYKKLGWVEIDRAMGEHGEYVLLELTSQA